MKLFMFMIVLLVTTQAYSFTKKECQNFVNRLDHQARQAERLSLKFLEAGALSPELISTSEQKKDYEYYGLASENAEKKVDDLKQKLIQCL